MTLSSASSWSFLARDMTNQPRHIWPVRRDMIDRSKVLVAAVSSQSAPTLGQFTPGEAVKGADLPKLAETSIVRNIRMLRKFHDMKVSSAEFQKQFGSLADKALIEPLTITRNGRDRLVLLSVEEYQRLKRRDRRVVRLEDFTDAEMALIAKADVPAEHAHLDAELKDWQP